MIRTAAFIFVAAVALIAPQSACADGPLFSTAAARSAGKRSPSYRLQRSLLQDTSSSSSSTSASATVSGSGTSSGSGSATSTVSTTIVSAAECSASASASSVSFSISRFLSTYTRAVADVCVQGGTASDFKEAIRTGTAVAFASAVADTQLMCTSQGFAYSCGLAEASSDDWADSFGGVYAAGFASAIASCGSCATVATSASAYADTLVNLVAEASAFAQSQACVENGEAISVSAWSSCFAEAVAHLTSTAVADAFAVGECGNAFADVFVSAVAEAEIVLDTSCSSAADVDGSGDGGGETDGSADATSTS